MKPRAMKASGLGWAPKVPSHWDVAKICLLARLESGHTPSRQHPEYWIPDECTIPWFSLADIWQLRPGVQEYVGETSEKISARGAANSAARVLPAGTVVLSRTASVGFAGIMSIPMATTQDFANWIPGERISSEYLLYALRAMPDEFERVRYGSTHNTIYMPDIRRLAIPVPPRVEQEGIVRFLRELLPKVDELIAKKEHLVALLAEKRQALITQLVTKGLDPNAPMKDSGVEWFPQIPEGTTVEQLRRRLAGIEQGWSPSCESRPAEAEEWGVVKAGCANYGRFHEDENKALPVSETPIPSLEIRSGDVLMSRANTRELVGSAACVLQTRPRLLLCDKIFRLKYHRAAVDPEFLAMLLQSHVAREQIEQDATGASGSMQNIGQDTVLRLSFPWPSFDQQRAVARVGREQTESLDRGVDVVERSLDRLREYRQAFITAAVTGQIDVTSEHAVAAHEARAGY